MSQSVQPQQASIQMHKGDAQETPQGEKVEQPVRVAQPQRVAHTPPDGPPWWLTALAIVMIPLGLAAPFGTTILGWVAVGQIRRSAGRLHGLWLAVADGLLYPLILLNVGIVWLLILIGEGFLEWPSRLNSSQSAQLAVVSILLCLTVDFLIIRAVWRSLTKGPTDVDTKKEPLGPTLALQAGLLGILVILLISVVPTFAEVYQIFQGEYPSAARFIIHTVMAWKAMLFLPLFALDALICLMIRGLWGKRGLRLWNIASVLGLILAIGLMFLALMKPLQTITGNLGDSHETTPKMRNSDGVNPEATPVSIGYQSLQSEAKALIARHFPKAVGTTLGDETTFTLNLRDYEVHNGSKTGTLAQQTTRETGPAAIGFRLTIQRLKAPLVSQAELPQFFDRPYWKSYGNTSFDTKTGEGIAVYYDFGAALPPAFHEAMLQLLQLAPAK